jgi:hypothetical protein
MYRNHKIATCCYCGQRTVLQLAGPADRHALVCAGCGAPLRQINRRGGAAPGPTCRPATGMARRAENPANDGANLCCVGFSTLSRMLRKRPLTCSTEARLHCV